MPKPLPKIRQATTDDHAEIVKIAKQSKYTKDYTNMIFSGEDCYAAGRIRVLTLLKKVVGFSCIRHRTRNPATVLYFVGVDLAKRGEGYGTLLMYELEGIAEKAGRERIELKVMKENRACDLYRKLGYEEVGEAYEGKAFVLSKTIKPPQPEDRGG
jgi:ribosomal protein S18 acetylase RimI-like enzyme